MPGCSRRDFLKLSASAILGLALDELGLFTVLVAPADFGGMVEARRAPFPTLEEFVEKVKKDNEAEKDKTKLRGIYVNGSAAKIDDKIVQILGNVASYNPDTMSQLDLVAYYGKAFKELEGAVALLVHNTTTSGKEALKLKNGDKISTVSAGGGCKGYEVNIIYRYKCISNNPERLENLDPPYDQIEGRPLLDKVYKTGKPHVVVQTCLADPGDPTNPNKQSWGRIFICGNPV